MARACWTLSHVQKSITIRPNPFITIAAYVRRDWLISTDSPITSFSQPSKLELRCKYAISCVHEIDIQLERSRNRPWLSWTSRFFETGSLGASGRSLICAIYIRVESDKMHFALPPRKSSHPPPYARTHRSSPVRRKNLQFGILIGCATLALLYLASQFFSDSPATIPPGTPEIVIVTLIDPDSMSQEYISKIKENREHYAAKHGL